MHGWVGVTQQSIEVVVIGKVLMWQQLDLIDYNSSIVSIKGRVKMSISTAWTLSPIIKSTAGVTPKVLMRTMLSHQHMV